MSYFFYRLKYSIKSFFRRWYFTAEKWYLVRLRKRTQTCPRRSELGVASQVFKDPDYWRLDNTCSYCGGLNPERFLEEVRNGAEVEPTNKSYKAYVHVNKRMYKIYFQHFNDPHKKEFVRLYNDHTMKIGYPGCFYAKPYFVQIRGGKTEVV
jgi:hypothetical protein